MCDSTPVTLSRHLHSPPPPLPQVARLQAVPKRHGTVRCGTAQYGTVRHGAPVREGPVRRADIRAGRRRSGSGSPRDGMGRRGARAAAGQRFRVEAETVAAATGRERGQGDGYNRCGAGRLPRSGRKQCPARKCPGKLRRRRRGLGKQEWRSCGGERCGVLLGPLPSRLFRR